MENKIINIKRCTDSEIKECSHPISNKKWGDEFVCHVLRPIDCPKLLCEGEPCLAGAVIDTNSEQVEFPCSGCKKPTSTEKEVSKAELIKSLKDLL